MRSAGSRDTAYASHVELERVGIVEACVLVSQKWTERCNQVGTESSQTVTEVFGVS